MRRTKRLTRNQRKEAAAILRAQEKPPSKPHKIKKMFSLTLYLQKKEEKKLAKAHHRHEKRDAKEGKEHAH